METAVLLVLAMLIAAPIAGYLRATAWAIEQDLVPKETLHGEAIAMSLH